MHALCCEGRAKANRASNTRLFVNCIRLPRRKSSQQRRAMSRPGDSSGHLAPRQSIRCRSPATSACIRCRSPSAAISLITASSSPGLMCVMCTSTPAVQLRQLLAQRRRAQVAADARELALVVAERGLDHQVRAPSCRAGAATAPGSARCRRCRPSRRRGRVDRKADRRHGVRGLSTSMRRLAELSIVADREGHQRQHRLVGARQPGEVGPDDAVEDVLAQRRPASRAAHAPGSAAGRRRAAHHAVGQQADRRARGRGASG